MPKSALERALLEAELKYGGQLGQVKSLLSDRAQAYNRERRVNASTARGIQAATAEATPKVAEAFKLAQATALAQQQALGATDTDQARAFARRNSEALSGALTDLANRGARAEEGRAYANQQARSEYFGDKSKIQGQSQALEDEARTYASARYGDLLDAQQKIDLDTAKFAEDRRHNKAQESLTAESNQTARIKAQRDARKAKKPKIAAPKEHASFRSEVDRAMSVLEREKGATGSRAKLIDLLVTGRPVMKVKNSKGDDVTIPPIKPVSGDAARAAANLLFDGSLSRGDVNRLHGRGLSIRLLGYRTRKKGWKPQTPPKGPTSAPILDAFTGPFKAGR